MKRRLFTILSILILVIVVVPRLYVITLKKIYPKKYSYYIEVYSEKYEIEEEWLYAIIKAESNFKSDSISR